jgi:hypothetical protein
MASSTAVTKYAPAQIYRASQFRNAGAICSPDIDQNTHRSTKEREFGAGVGSETDVCCSRTPVLGEQQHRLKTFAPLASRSGMLRESQGCWGLRDAGR